MRLEKAVAAGYRIILYRIREQCKIFNFDKFEQRIF